MSSSETNIENGRDKADFIRKGNELFNKGDIILAYKCYTMAGYSAGIEKVADHYFYNEKSPAKAIVLYKKLANESGNERIQEKLSEVSQKIVKVLRKWIAEDVEPEETTLEQKRQYLSTLVNQQKNKFHTREVAKKSSSKITNEATDVRKESITSQPYTTGKNSPTKDSKDSSVVKKAPFPFNKFGGKDKK